MAEAPPGPWPCRRICAGLRGLGGCACAGPKPAAARSRIRTRQGPTPVPMRYRLLGETSLQVSEIGFGCSALGGGLFGPGTRGALDIVARAVAGGVTFFDTSD